MRLLERLFGREESPRREEQQAREIVHFGYLGKRGSTKPPYFKAELTIEEDQKLNEYFQLHKHEPGMFCEMDAIAKLFPDRLIPISTKEWLALRSQEDEVYTLFD